VTRPTIKFNQHHSACEGTLTLDFSRVKVARLCRRCDIGLKRDAALEVDKDDLQVEDLREGQTSMTIDEPDAAFTSLTADEIVKIHDRFIMSALRSRCRHYIFALWFLLSSFFPRRISAVGDWMSTILPQMVCLSANLGCRSET